MTQELHRLKRALEQLQPTGNAGVEGLIKKLLEATTGRQYYLARSGSQEGRDLSTAGASGTWVAVEVKQYQSTPPAKTQLLGYLMNAHVDARDLDLWVLATTTEIPEQTAAALAKAATDLGVAVQILDWASGDLAKLPVLCASAPKAVVDFLGEREFSQPETDGVREDLEGLACNPGFDEATNKIRQEFSEANIGYDHARQSSNEHLNTSMADPRAAKARLHQLLDIANPSGRLIHRRAAAGFLNEWWRSWPQNPRPAILLGEEGTGKTWAAMSWWLGLGDSAPLTIFVPSGRNEFENPREIIASELALLARFADCEYWDRRLSGWLKRPVGGSPQLLLVIDGLNERPNKKWRTLFHALEAMQNRGRIAVVATCRNRYWEEEIDLGSLEDEPATHLICEYDDDEFGEALSEFELTSNDLSADLNKALRKPRFFRVARDYLQRGNRIEAVTLDWLFFSDWQNRYQNKVDHLNLTPRRFSKFLKRLASDYRKSNESATYDGRTLREIMAAGGAPESEFFTDLRELVDGDLIHCDKSDNNAFTINERILPHALGHLLADQAAGSTDPGETVAQYLEHYEGTDFAIAVRRSAAILAALIKEYPAQARTALWDEWFSSHNQKEQDYVEIYGLAQERPAIFLDFAEVSRSSWRYHAAGMQLRRAVLQISAKGQHHELLSSRFQRWLGTINTEGLYLQRLSNRSLSEETRSKIKQHIEEISQSESLRSCVRIVTEESTEHEWLSSFALKIISMDPKPGYAAAIVSWGLSRSVLGFPHENEEVSWILRHNDGAGSLAEFVEQQANEFARDENLVALRTASILYRAIGSRRSHAAHCRLPSEITAPAQWWADRLKDPCHAFGRWKREHLRTCLERTDIEIHRKLNQLKRAAVDPGFRPPHSIIEELNNLSVHDSIDRIQMGRQRTKADLDRETIEPILAAYDAAALARLTRAIVNDLPNRGETALFLLATELPQYYPLVETKERDSIAATWKALDDRYAQLSRDGRHAEAALTTILLATATADKQLQLLLGRDHDAGDRKDWEKLFANPGQERQHELICQAAAELATVQSRRILWFLTRHAISLTPQSQEILVRLTQHDDSLVRAMALRIIGNTGDTATRQAIVDSGWASHDEDGRFLESWHGSFCLATSDCRGLRFSDLRARILPELLGYAIEQRGNRPQEIGEYAETIDLTLNRIRTSNRSDDIPQFRLLFDHDEEPSDFPLPRLISVDEAAAVGLAARKSYWSQPLEDKLDLAFSIPNDERYEKRRTEAP
jgi:hypothetical protein